MIIEQFILAGAERMALALSHGLSGRGVSVTVSPIKPGGLLREDFIQAADKVVTPLAHGKYDVSAAVKLARIIKQERIDAVIVVDVLRNGLFFTALAEIISRAKACLNGKRVSGTPPVCRRICWCHSLPSGQAGEFVRWLKWYFRRGLLDTLVCVSKAQREAIIEAGLDESRVVLIPNGVDLSLFAESKGTSLPLPPDKRVIVQVANRVPDKDFDTLLTATRRLADIRDDFHLVLVGRGVDSEQMRGMVRRLDLAGQITLAGQREDVTGILQRADVLVLSSRRESFGLSVLEGMAAGLPVIVSDVPVFEELLEDGREGLKVPLANPDALADALVRLLDDESLRKRMGRAGEEKARQFSISKMVEGFYRLLEDAISKQGRVDADTAR